MISASYARSILTPNQTQSAFTLIELILVISIIAVLSLLMLGGIRTVRALAEAVTCSAHLRQLSAANFSYSTDHRGVIMPYAHSWSTANPRVKHMDWRGEYRIYLGEDDSTLGAIALRGDQRIRTVSQGCPTFFRLKRLNNNGVSDNTGTMLQWGNSGYGYTVKPLSHQPSTATNVHPTGALNGNWTPSNSYNAAGRFITLSQITHMSRRAMFADAFQSFLPWAPSRLESIDQKILGNGAWSAGTPWRHGRGYNIAYFDGRTAHYSGEPLSLPIYAPSLAP